MRLHSLLFYKLRGLATNLKSSEFYISQAFQFFSVIFIIFLWLYIARFHTDISSKTVLVYFSLVATFYYLFTNSFGVKFGELLDFKADEMRLNPGGTILSAFIDRLVPLFLASLPFVVIVLGVSIIFKVLTFQICGQILVLLLYSHIYYFFINISMELVARFINWKEYMAFALRYIGVPWNGSYIPYIFFTGTLKLFNQISPFSGIGLFLQLVWSDDLNFQAYIKVSLIWLIFWILSSLGLLKTYFRLKN